MKSVRLRYIHRVKDRYGQYRYYLRRPGQPLVRLPDVGEDGFFQACAEAMSFGSDKSSPFKPRTLAWLIEEWQKSGRFLALSASTRTNYRRILINMQREDYAEHMVTDFEAVHIRRFVSRLSDRPAAANHRLKLFRMLFDHAVSDGWRVDNPAVSVKRYREKGEGAETWSEGHIQQFEEYWGSGTLPRRALALLLYTGQRRSDVVRIGPVHRRGDLLSLRQQKTGKELLVPVHPVLEEELAKAPLGPAYLLRSDGVPFTANGFYMRFRGWREAAGLPAGLSPHGLRKAAARRLAEAGCSVHQIAAITGHQTLAEVQRYTRAADQERLAREAMNRIRNVKQSRKM